MRNNVEGENRGNLININLLCLLLKPNCFTPLYTMSLRSFYMDINISTELFYNEVKPTNCICVEKVTLKIVYCNDMIFVNISKPDLIIHKTGQNPIKHHTKQIHHEYNTEHI